MNNSPHFLKFDQNFNFLYLSKYSQKLLLTIVKSSESSHFFSDANEFSSKIFVGPRRNGHDDWCG